MRVEDFDYELPKELIAQHPLEKRSDSKLLVLNKENGEIEHKKFVDILSLISPDDCLVINNTRVIPARIISDRMELLLLKRVEKDRWECLVKPGKRAKIDAEFEFGNGKLKAKIVDILDEGNRIVEFYYDGIWEETLDQLGEMPLPPYITEKLDDKERYQTVYSKLDGSAAAPTAGLHFTDELLDELRAKGVKIAELTLHVGLGTFRPVKVDVIEEHKMHSEWFDFPQSAAEIVKNCKGSVIAVGTTSSRVLETIAKNGEIKAQTGWTDIFIYPPYKFKIVDKLITNFHLPKSTLTMLVSSLAGKENIFRAYEEAKREKYRFFSFGDAMFIS